MFKNYTENAKRTMVMAKSEAARLGSLVIDPEHILLALLADEGLVGRLMVGASASEIREDILANLRRRKELPTPVDLPLSGQSRDVLAVAQHEAKDLGHRHVSNGHILLGLLSVRNSRVTELLGGRGLSPDRVRSQIADHENSRTASLEELAGVSNLAMRPQVDSPVRSLMLTTIPQVKELTRRGEQRRALKLLDDLMAESVPERNLRIRHLAPLATATARSIRDFDLARHYCELRLTNDPDDVLALYGMADCFVEQGNINEARPYIIRCFELGALRKDPISQGVVELLEKRFPELKLG